MAPSFACWTAAERSLGDARAGVNLDRRRRVLDQVVGGCQGSSDGGRLEEGAVMIRAVVFDFGSVLSRTAPDYIGSFERDYGLTREQWRPLFAGPRAVE